MLIAGSGRHHIVRAWLICAVLDLPTKVLYCNRYNEMFRRSVCKDSGQMVRFRYLIFGGNSIIKHILQVSVGRG